MEIKDKIKLLREMRRWSQPELAERCGWGYNQSRISHYETGNREPKLRDLQTIAKALGISMEALIDDEVPAELPPIESMESIAVRQALRELDQEGQKLILQFALYLSSQK